jgi:hypothetical protein
MILAACQSLKLTLRTTFVPLSRSRNAKADHPTLNWSVTLERDGRDVLTTDYQTGIGHAPAYNAPVRTHGGANSVMRAAAIKMEAETGREARPLGGQGSFQPTGKQIEPDAAGIIACLVMDAGVIDHASFEDWADEYGYDPDSRSAERTYRACLETALQLRAAVGDAGLEILRTACAGY